MCRLDYGDLVMENYSQIYKVALISDPSVKRVFVIITILDNLSVVGYRVRFVVPYINSSVTTVEFVLVAFT